MIVFERNSDMTKTHSRPSISPQSITAFSPFWCGAILVALSALTACQQPAEPGPQDEARAEQLRPQSTALAEKYERSCMVCHSRIAANAPLTGFAPAWKARLEKGMETLVRNAQQGLGSMPPGGQCADCTTEELRALVVFMAHDH
jgi:cytochrome c5